VHNPAAMYRAFEVLNAHFAAPHWVRLSAKAALCRLLRDAGLEGVVAPRCYFTAAEKQEEKEKEEKEEDVDPRATAVAIQGDGEGEDGGDCAGLWILKGKNRVYEGVTTQRVVRVESAAELAAALAAASGANSNKKGTAAVAAAAPQARAAVMAQRCVANPLLVAGGTRKATLHFYVCVTDVSVDVAVNVGELPKRDMTDAASPTADVDAASTTAAAAATALIQARLSSLTADASATSPAAAAAAAAVVIQAGLSTGFTLKTCPDAYSEDYEGAAAEAMAGATGMGGHSSRKSNGAHITGRDAGGDIARCDRREVFGCGAEAWAAEVKH